VRDCPAIIECITRRIRGHYEGDPQKYRDAEELQSAGDDDPLMRAEAQLRGTGVDDAALKAVGDEIDAAIDAAIALARQDAEPDYALARQDVYAATCA